MSKTKPNKAKKTVKAVKKTDPVAKAKTEIQTIKENIQAFNKRLAAQRKDYAKQTNAELMSVFKSIFDLWPCVKSIGWDQFTPDWNDGDTCYFGVNDIYVNGKDTYDDEEDAEEEVEVELSKEDAKSIKEATAIVSNLIRNSESMLEEIFGDHATVTITRGNDGKSLNVSKTTCDHEDY